MGGVNRGHCKNDHHLQQWGGLTPPDTHMRKTLHSLKVLPVHGNSNRIAMAIGIAIAIAYRLLPYLDAYCPGWMHSAWPGCILPRLDPAVAASQMIAVLKVTYGSVLRNVATQIGNRP